jgi:hypothetical protein
MEFLEAIDENILGGLSWAAMPYIQAMAGQTIKYLDVISLFPSVMCGALPVGAYRRRPDLENSLDEVKRLIQDYVEDQPKGYLIECDFIVPERYHDEVDFPPVCKMPIPDSMLSPYQLDLFKLYGAERDQSYAKLVPFLGEHKRSGRHIALLQVWSKHCHIEILRVHRVFEFDQRPVLREYMETLNLRKRHAPNPVARQNSKITMCATYGRMYLNKKKQCSADVRSDPWNFFVQVSKGGVKWHVVQTDPFIGVLDKPPSEITIQEPRAVGWAILDLARAYFWRFYYECIKTTWKGVKLAYHDTDSIVVQLPTTNFVKQALAWNKLPPAKTIGAFDLGEHGPKFKKLPEHGELGTIKDEKGPVQIDKVACLCSKTWALRCGEEADLKGKGIPKGFLERYGFEDYKRQLFDPEPVKAKFKAIGVRKFQSIKRDCTKKSISFENDKTFIWREGDSFHSRPLGHKDNVKTRAQMNC